MAKILIVVEGGVVSGVFSDNEELEVQIFDIDNLEKEGVDVDEEFSKAREGLEPIA